MKGWRCTHTHTQLIEVYPDACLECNCWGSLPIHVGLVNGMPQEQIRVLIEAEPSTVGTWLVSIALS